MTKTNLTVNAGKVSRPTGVTILAILAILGAIVSILLGAVLLLASAVLGASGVLQSQISAVTATYPGLSGFTVGLITTLLLAFGVVALLLGVLQLAVGAAFLGGKGWAWTIGIVVGIINIVVSIALIAIGSYTNVVVILIWIGIIYYLTRAHVKRYFGKGPAQPTMSTPS